MVSRDESRQVSAVEVRGVDELWDGEMACFRVGGTDILFLKLDGQIRAYQAHCPHQGVALAEGELEGGILTCRAHRWQFNAANGQGVNPKSAHLRCFPVDVVRGKVMIKVELGGTDVDSEL